MKLLFTIALLVFFTSANATVRMVTCQNDPSHFLPVTLNAVSGDTIRWTWVSGHHIVGPINATYIPSGAAMFNGPVNSSNHTFEYVVTVAGIYNYDCHPAGPHGETASIVVSAVTGLQAPHELAAIATVYPNPSNGMLRFIIGEAQLTKNSKIEVYNLQGQKVYQSEITNTEAQIDLTPIGKGIYFVRFYNKDAMINKEITIE
jgi:plastocyanin